ncbi:ScbR family autoregulator-binding transcription factor [Streptomyces sp. NPDC054783]
MSNAHTPRSTRTATRHQASRPAPKQARAAQTRAQVLAAAAELFAERGFPHTSIAGIAEQVGMTKGALYFHFRDKEDIAAEVVRELYDRWRELAEEAHAAGLQPMETVQALLSEAANNFFNDDVVKAGARLQAERSLADATLPEPYVEWISTVSTLLAKARGAGQLREGVDPEAAAHALVSALFGTQHICDVLNRRADLPRRWAEVSDLLFPSIMATPE